MIRLKNINISIDNDSISNLLNKCSKKLRIDKNLIKNYKIVKKSLDARKKPNLFYCYEIDILINNEEFILKKNRDKFISIAPIEEYKFPIPGNLTLKNSPVIV